MERVIYGRTGLKVSRLCIGCGHFNSRLPDLRSAARLLLTCLDSGVNFWDTAEMYGTQPHVGEAVAQLSRDQVIIQTKTGAADKAGAHVSIERALSEMRTDYLDIMLLHGLSSPEDLTRRQGALEAMLEAKQAGQVRHVGCSTHIYTGPVMDAVIEHPDLECILLTLNKEGRMLEGGTLESHLPYVEKAYQCGKGVSLMKVIAGGQVEESRRPEFIRWAFGYPHAHALNLGICSIPELEQDLELERETSPAWRLRRAA